MVNYKGPNRLGKLDIYFLWIKIKTIVQLLELSAGLALTEACDYCWLVTRAALCRV